MTLELTIVSPTTKKVIHVLWLEVQTPTGSLIIEPEHAPLVSVLSPNKELIFAVKPEVTEAIIIPTGILIVDRKKATVIINQ